MCLALFANFPVSLSAAGQAAVWQLLLPTKKGAPLKIGCHESGTLATVVLVMTHALQYFAAKQTHLSLNT